MFAKSSKKSLLPLSLIAVVAAVAFADEPQKEPEEFNGKMAFEVGHIVKGENREAGGISSPLNLMPLYRNIVSLGMSGKLGEDWEYAAGLKGIMWWPYSTDQSIPLTRTVRIEPRPSIMKIAYNFRTDENKSFVEFGYFPYKYNRDAANLGEYLYRSGTYPGIVFTSDGYQLMDHAFFDAYGAHARLTQLNGVLTHDFNLFSEVAAYPEGDLTPAYELSVNLPLFQFGLGAAYNRGISFAPSKTVPKDPQNQYIEQLADSTHPYYKGPYQGDTSLVSTPNLPYTVLHEWTERGVKLMGRAAVDLGFLLPENLRGPDDLRVYTEVALLGVENQPYYYEDRAQRMPVMFGINIPTARALDLLAFQMEYYSSPFNGTKDFNDTSRPIWTVKNYDTKDLSYYKASNWKWSCYASKSINRLLKVKAQVANDHLRLRTFDTFSYTNFDLTQGAKNWYYLMQMEVGI